MNTSTDPDGGPDPQDDDGLAMLIDHVSRARGFDLGGYKEPTVRRRIAKRVQHLELDSIRAYVDHLQVHPKEYDDLFDTLLINVTSFFRDEQTWIDLRERILPRVLESRDDGDDIRVWSAGCSSGEEAYSVAMILADLMGDEFGHRVKIYGTDVDPDALAQARHATYRPEQLAPVPDDLRERYVVPTTYNDVPGHVVAAADDGALTIRPDVRRAVIFGDHDLLRDAPISRLDLLVCRNTMMYFNADVQRQVLDRFHFALRPDGVLFLGKAEKLLSHGDTFTPLDDGRQFFVRVGSGEPAHRMIHRTFDRSPRTADAIAVTLDLRDAAFDVGPAATVAVDGEGHLVLANRHARALFSLDRHDLGRPLRDMELSYRPVELRGAIDRSHDTGEPVHVTGVPWPIDGEDGVLDVSVVAVTTDDRALTGAIITFTNVTTEGDLTQQVIELSGQLDTAYDELQATNEELETTNEELQSTIEELETTNEELQSTNEELETMNEELQSTNDELHTTNEELFVRSNELDDVNAFLESILTGLDRGVVVTDRDLLVKVWNPRSADMWGLREDEVRGRSLVSLDIGLPVESLLADVHAALDGAPRPVERAVAAHNRRGQAVQVTLTITSLRTTAGETEGVILLMQEHRTDDT